MRSSAGVLAALEAIDASETPSLSASPWRAELALPIRHGSLTLQESPVQESLFVEESTPVRESSPVLTGDVMDVCRVTSRQYQRRMLMITMILPSQYIYSSVV